MLTPSVQQPEALTPADSKLRFADGIIDEARNSIITVQEDHSGSGEAVNTIAIVGVNLAKMAVNKCPVQTLLIMASLDLISTEKLKTQRQSFNCDHWL